MYPFNPFFRPLSPFGFKPFGFRQRCRVNSLMGIPVLRTTGVSATATSVSYDVNEREFFSLPKEGIFFLDVRQSAPTGSDNLPVVLNDGEESANAPSLLRNGIQEEVPASDLVISGRYLIYYNRCTK